MTIVSWKYIILLIAVITIIPETDLFGQNTKKRPTDSRFRRPEVRSPLRIRPFTPKPGRLKSPHQIVLERRVSFKVSNIPLRQALDQLIDQTGISLLYSDATVNNIISNCNCKNTTIESALDQLLSGTSITYQITSSGYLVLRSK